MDNTIVKAGLTKALTISDGDMAEINSHSLRELSPDEVFVFRVAMCDNRIDRDFEVFPEKSLRKMAELFVGRTVISDHSRKSGNQVARIYSTQVERIEGDSDAGEPNYRLVARCYIPKTESTAELITQIESGIKKEVSISCAIGSVVCSVCGADNRKVYCEHYPGRTYEGSTCFFRLEDPKDAYELSFVAVPAQRNAGVVKNYGGVEPSTVNTNYASIRLKLLDAFVFENKEEEK